jgi:hypothetical protein
MDSHWLRLSALAIDAVLAHSALSERRLTTAHLVVTPATVAIIVHVVDAVVTAEILARRTSRRAGTRPTDAVRTDSALASGVVDGALTQL